MSCDVNIRFLEQKFEEALELGMTETEAENYAHESLEDCGG